MSQELTVKDFPIEKYYCRASTRSDASAILYIFKTGIAIVNRCGQAVHVEYAEAVSESVTFSNKQMFSDQKSLGKQSASGSPPLEPNFTFTMEWDYTFETDQTSARPTLIKFKVFLKLRERASPLEYTLNMVPEHK